MQDTLKMSSQKLHINPEQTLRVAQYVANSLPVLCLGSAFFFPGALTTLALSAIRFSYLFFLALRTPIINTQNKMAGNSVNHCFGNPTKLLRYLLQALSFFISELFSDPLALCTTLLSVFYIQINTLNQVLSAFSIGMFSNILNSAVEIGLFALLFTARYFDHTNQTPSSNSKQEEKANTAIIKRENIQAFAGGSLLMLWLVHDELSLLAPSLAPVLMIFALPEVEVLLALYYTWNMLQWASIHCISDQTETPSVNSSAKSTIPPATASDIRPLEQAFIEVACYTKANQNLNDEQYRKAITAASDTFLEVALGFGSKLSHSK